MAAIVVERNWTWRVARDEGGQAAEGSAGAQRVGGRVRGKTTAPSYCHRHGVCLLKTCPAAERAYWNSNVAAGVAEVDVGRGCVPVGEEFGGYSAVGVAPAACSSRSPKRTWRSRSTRYDWMLSSSGVERRLSGPWCRTDGAIRIVQRPRRKGCCRRCRLSKYSIPHHRDTAPGSRRVGAGTGYGSAEHA